MDAQLVGRVERLVDRDRDEAPVPGRELGALPDVPVEYGVADLA